MTASIGTAKIGTASMVERRANDEPPAWTIGRVSGWAGAALVLLFVTGIAVGMLSAYLDRGTGMRIWGGRLSVGAPVLAFAILTGIGWLALRRSWPRPAAPDADEWQRRAATRARRTMAAWVGTIMTFAAGGIAVSLAAWMGVGTVAGTALLVGGIALAVVGAVWGTVVYMRVIDEQERQANLLSGYAGLATYLGLFLIQALLDRIGVVLPRLDHAIFLAVALVTSVTFVIARFR